MPRPQERVHRPALQAALAPQVARRLERPTWRLFDEEAVPPGVAETVTVVVVRTIGLAPAPREPPAEGQGRLYAFCLLPRLPSAVVAVRPQGEVARLARLHVVPPYRLGAGGLLLATMTLSDAPDVPVGRAAPDSVLTR